MDQSDPDSVKSVCQRSPRAPVFLLASIEVDGAIKDVKLRNISTGGALVEGINLPGEGTLLVFRRSGTETGGIVAWSDGRFAGIRFHGELRPEAVLRTISKPSVQPLPTTDYRRPGFRSRPLSAADMEWARRWSSAPDIDR